MSTQVQLRRDTAANVAAFTGAQGEVIVDTTNNRLVAQDGATPGGFAAAKLSEVVTLGASSLVAQAAHGGGLSAGCLEQLVTLAGAITTSSMQIPAGAIVLAVSNRVVTAITGATRSVAACPATPRNSALRSASARVRQTSGSSDPIRSTPTPPCFTPRRAEISPVVRCA